MGDLKKENGKPLMGLLLVTVAPIYLSVAFLHWEWLAATASGWTLEAWGQLAAVGVTPLLCVTALLSLMSGFVRTSWKERLVHFRWRDPLPGCRSDLLLACDHRIDMATLPPEVSALQEEGLGPRERNSRWYSNVYLPVREVPAVRNTHRKYLLHRDAAAGVFTTTVAVLFADVIAMLVWDVRIMTGIGDLSLVLYLLLLAVTANEAGKRMVTGSIANFLNHEHSGGVE